MRAYITVAFVAALAAAPAIGATDWSQFQHDSYNSGITGDSGPAGLGSLGQAWSANVYDGPGSSYGLKFQPGTSPVVSNGVLYAYALGDFSADWTCAARLVALNAADGSVKWVSAALQDEGGYNSHNGASVDPASGDILVASWNTLYRISAADGSIVWQHVNPGSNGVNAVVNGAPAVGNGKAYWMSQSNGSLTGVDLNAGTGGAVVPASLNVAMPTDVGGNSYGTPLLFASGGTTYAVMSWGHGFSVPPLPMGGGIQVVNANTGSVLWSMTQAAAPVGSTTNDLAAYSFTGSATYADGVIYARSFDDQLGHTFNATLWALSATTGEVLWRTWNMSAAPGAFDNAVNGQGAPIVAGDKVFIGGGTALYGGAGQSVMAFSATDGRRLWSVGGVGGWGNQIAYANGKLFVGSEVDPYSPSTVARLTVLNADDGSVLGSYVGAGTSPIVVGGVVYTVDTNGHMVALATPGDANFDGIVDMKDYITWFNNFGSTAGVGWSGADFNADGIVDMTDYIAWFDNFGQGGGSPGVPEPAGLALLALGGLAMLGRRRR
ncbi:MAG: PQQ-binding-like beta-propeller repeat protein [Phycisphaerae bacterium]